MNGARWLAQALVAEGVDTLFGYPGGTIMPFYDALHGTPALKHVLVRHEQGAAFAANGYARASGRVGVCVATSGPGASNLVTGIADAMLDSVPMVVITGQVPTTLMGTDAFQELDVFAMTLPMVKHSFIARRVEDLPMMVAEAFRLARSGRPGPVLIDLPKDVQMAAAAHLPAHAPLPVDAAAAPKDASLHEALALISQAQRPVLYGGGGIALGDAVQDFRTFVDATQIPTVLTLKGLGALPTRHPLNLGMLGMHGSRAANLAVQESDLLVVVGARFDDRATGKLAEFAPHARVVHMDLEACEIGKLRCADAGVRGDIRTTLARLTLPCAAHLHGRNGQARKAWRAQCRQRAQQHAARYDAPGDSVFAPALLKRLSELAPDAVVACDVGQHQMWVAQHWRLDHPRKHLTSGALGAMGFGLPAAIGAQLQDPAARVVCVSGDGSIQMNIQELATLRRYQLPVKIVLLDNQALGMVRQWQELFFDKRYSEVDLSDNPDFVALARAFGIQALHLDRADGMDAALQALLAAEGPALLHVAIDTAANVWPLVPPNRSNSEMLEDAATEAAPAIRASNPLPESTSVQEA
ncbi:MAG: acetolactate synthase 2 catalytic subunit [Thermomonas sp.]|uniref:acetolactate synthase 2 catalytic subunit n=1 Tax=Thermomonas sp. TaxID=1971895 RepID=UPI001B6B10B2|nr:acetolactate synthase 2 catalytic subunit [Thermomonas sp.]MBK6416575.1 acetolactate synthase 2 catalytic subunit [Thermomonas sp.]MBK9669430.1 acetolactate synthase 2 catalytic subunit [Thermomonas sp.]MBP7158257.1 acetolactate synthase 2 catalytic subunit [Thermomonas sp.]MBP7787984.1 acetolactate synthase 2 catalytic subunit [Thermomonas sp.]MBP9696012.1 acetolactate synthase 2 catalytic subunit [Thermomonas sp.]